MQSSFGKLQASHFLLMNFFSSPTVMCANKVWWHYFRLSNKLRLAHQRSFISQLLSFESNGPAASFTDNKGFYDISTPDKSLSHARFRFRSIFQFYTIEHKLKFRAVRMAPSIGSGVWPAQVQMHVLQVIHSFNYPRDLFFSSFFLFFKHHFTQMQCKK